MNTSSKKNTHTWTQMLYRSHQQSISESAQGHQYDHNPQDAIQEAHLIHTESVTQAMKHLGEHIPPEKSSRHQSHIACQEVMHMSVGYEPESCKQHQEEHYDKRVAACDQETCEHIMCHRTYLSTRTHGGRRLAHAEIDTKKYQDHTAQ